MNDILDEEDRLDASVTVYVFEDEARRRRFVDQHLRSLSQAF
jgi:hypothetical protein